MKKLIMSIMVVMIATTLFSQNSKVLSAYNYLRNGQLDKAKQFIDEALVYEQTKIQARTWFYAGNIYLSISLTDNPKYKGLDTNSLQVSYNAYQKAIELDPEIENASINLGSPKIGLMLVGQEYYKIGATKYTEKKYNEALNMFEMSKKINGIFGIKDSISTYIAASCALTLNDDKKAKTLLSELDKMNYKEPLVYYNLATILRKDGDTTKAINCINRGLNLMPNDHKMLYTAGIYYDETGKVDLSEKSYQKAIEMKPDFFDAYYNLGALFVNSASKLMEEANKLPYTETKKYDELKLKADDLLKKALPALETAEKLNPTDYNTLVTLKQIYARMSNAEKIKEMDEKIANLKK